MNETEILLKQLMSFFGVKTYTELASKLEVAQNTISGWKARNSYEALCKILNERGIQLQKIDTITNGSAGIIIGSSINNSNLENNPKKVQTELHKLFGDCLKAAEAFDQTEYLKQVLIDTKREIAKKGLA
jgi:hypothetical protein